MRVGLREDRIDCLREEFFTIIDRQNNRNQMAHYVTRIFWVNADPVSGTAISTIYNPPLKPSPKKMTDPSVTPDRVSTRFPETSNTRMSRAPGVARIRMAASCIE